jgi:hypothetical protein
MMLPLVVTRSIIRRRLTMAAHCDGSFADLPSGPRFADDPAEVLAKFPCRLEPGRLIIRRNNNVGSMRDFP